MRGNVAIVALLCLLRSLGVTALVSKSFCGLQCRTGVLRPFKRYRSISDDSSNQENESNVLNESSGFGSKLWLDVSKFSQKISLPNILAGAVVGAVVATGTIFAPFILEDPFSSVPSTEREKIVQSIEEPVNLFEDILIDLQTGYVDPVNPTKLFETGVSAMLRSLDPYTEFENLDTAKYMQESVSGKYAGVGMVISGSKDIGPSTLPQKKDAPSTSTFSSPAGTGTGSDDSDAEPSTSPSSSTDTPTDTDTEGSDGRAPQVPGKSKVGSKLGKKDAAAANGVSVVDAFEGYAYDAGMRVGDRILSIDGIDTTKMTVEQVRDLLRGDPDTIVSVVFEREEKLPKGAKVSNIQPAFQVDDDGAASSRTILSDTPVQGRSPGKVVREVKITRKLVRMSDVRLATFLGDPQDGIGYINLGGFNSGAGRDFRQAFLMLRYSAPDDLKGLVLDLRGNPGGLLDAAVEISSYLVPAKSEIVSSKSRSGPEVVYKSTIEPIRPAGMKLAVLVNGGSASASEIVSGAIQDLDAGVIVGPTRTYGKGLVQKISPLPYDAALKYTIAKYYTPSGRCIQRVTYSGGRDKVAAAPAASTTDDASSIGTDDSGAGDDGAFIEDGEEDDGEEAGGSSGSPILPMRSPQAKDGARIVADKDRKTFFTVAGRPVRDGGGIEPDLKVAPLKAGPAESIFLTQGVYSDFISQYITTHDIRPALRDVAETEKELRLNDGRFITGLREGTLNQYFVLLEPIIGYDGMNTARYAGNSQQVVASSASSSGVTVETSTTEGQGSTTVSSSFKKPSRVIGNSKGVDIDSKLDDLFWVPIDADGESQERVRYSPAKARDRRNKMYAEFRQYVEKRIAKGELNLEASLGPKLDKLEKDLKAEGLQSVVDGIEQLRPKIKEGIMSDMDKNKEAIVDDIELAILSRELPDRLLLFKNIVKDPQVRVAAALVRGDDTTVVKMTLPAAGGESGNKDKSMNKGDIPLKKVDSIPGAGSSSGIYNTLLRADNKGSGVNDVGR